jgi:hypothetical protein
MFPRPGGDAAGKLTFKGCVLACIGSAFIVAEAFIAESWLDPARKNPARNFSSERSRVLSMAGIKGRLSIGVHPFRAHPPPPVFSTEAPPGFLLRSILQW